jgi:hypothetical protein
MILDVSKKEHIPMINMYKKCKGIALVDKYLPELSPLNKMYVINSEEDWEQVKDEFPIDMMTVRCDSPRGIEGKLPEGQTFHRDRVNQYIRDVKKLVPDAVIILEDLKEGTNERIHTRGGFNLDIKIGDYVYIDYAGPSFDCGILCRGKGSHESWVIPWEEVPFMKDSAVKKYKKTEINQTQYVETAKARIKFLLDAYPDKKDEIFETMPKRYNGIDINIFRDLRDKVIFPLYIRHEELSRDGMNHFGVELNVVKDGTLVPFEIDVPGRFEEKEDIEI